MKAEVDSKHRLVVAEGVVKFNVEDDMPEYASSAIQKLNKEENKNRYREYTNHGFQKHKYKITEWALIAF